jgi:hypothetical protein
VNDFVAILGDLLDFLNMQFLLPIVNIYRAVGRLQVRVNVSAGGDDGGHRINPISKFRFRISASHLIAGVLDRIITSCSQGIFLRNLNMIIPVIP